jgi:PEP-CTERM motif
MNLFKTLSPFVGAVLLCGTPAQAAPVSGQGTWETTLQARDLNGDGATDAFYDTELNVTWLRDANANGPMNWNAAKTWASNLVVGGYSGWRLPAIVDTGAPGCDRSNAGGTDCGFNVQTKSGSIVYSELAHLYYTTLGNKAYCAPGSVTCNSAPPGWGLTNTGNFQNLQSDSYWSGTEYAPDTGSAWYFYTSGGGQSSVYKYFSLYAVAVRPGDVTAAIPEPETYALMLAGLTALVVVQRRRAVSASAL